MKTVGTVARGIRTPIIQKGDDLIDIVTSSVLKASKEDGFQIQDKDIIAITEAVVGISSNNYAHIDDIAMDVKQKYKGTHLGIVFPILSRNRFSLLLKAFAQAFEEITVLLSYPADEVGNEIMNHEDLSALNINPYNDALTENDYRRHFGGFKHMFTGINMIDYYKEVIEKAGAKARFILSNNPADIYQYTEDVLVCDIHKRFKTYEALLNNEKAAVYRLDQILNKPINESGFNIKYGLLGSNVANEHMVKLFPNESLPLLLEIQKSIFNETGKHVEVMIYGDGAFKDPSSGIWELADPVVSPYYTKGLEGSPNEVKLKMLVDEAEGSKEAITEKIRKTIQSKSDNLVGQNISLGTTPRKYVDLIGSLCDLMSGSGDKGTPVILIQNYFTNYTI